MVARKTLEEFVRTVLDTKARLVDDVVEGRALGDAMQGDVLQELRRMVAQLGDAFGAARAEGADAEALEELLRQASDNYLRANAATLSEPARRELKPVSESAIRALAAALAGPERVIYAIASASNPKVSYRLEVDGADIACDCKGFAYRGMCRHARDLKKALATGAPLSADYRRVA